MAAPALETRRVPVRRQGVVELAGRWWPVALMAICVVATFMWINSRGISARAEPGRVETAVARTMRRLAIPRGDRNRPNPVMATPEVIAAGMAHYADHCAACHANDGSGETQIGLGLYRGRRTCVNRRRRP